MLSPALITLFLPLTLALAVGLVPALRKHGRVTAMLSCSFAVVAFMFALLSYQTFAASSTTHVQTVEWLRVGGQSLVSVGVRIDGISATMLVVITLVAMCVQIYSLGYLGHEPERHQARYFAWQSLFIFAMGTLVVAPNLLQLFIGWELVGLCSYLLIGYYWRKPSAAKAAVKAFWVTKFADMGLLIALLALYKTTGGFGWDVPMETQAATLVAGLLFIGVMGKSAQVPLHVWLPDAMEGPTPVSALLHAATMVAAGVFMIVRAYPIFEAAPDVLTVMAYIGSLTAFIAACTAVVQDDIKKVLAYSTCSQLGYMVAALGTGEMMGGYFHLTTHACFKALLFLAAGSAIHAVHSNSIFDMGGLLKKQPWTGWMFILGSLALAGIVPFSGFFSKDTILEELLHAHLWVPLGLCVAAAVLTAFYMTRVVVIAFLGEPTEHSAEAHESPPSMVGPMAALALLSVVAGLGAPMLADLWGTHTALSLSPGTWFTPIGIVGLIAAASGIAAGWIRYSKGGLDVLESLKPIGDFIHSGPVDRFWDSAWRKGLLPGARQVAWIDRYVVDGLINLIGVGTIEGAKRSRVLQTGQAQDYIFAVIVGGLLFVAFGLVI